MRAQALCRQAAEVLASRLVDRFPEVKAVVLYGSVARGEAREDSDVDLMVILKGDPEALRRPIFDAGQELLVEFPHVQTQVVVEEAAEFRRCAIEGYSLERTVARQGVALHDDGTFAAVREALPPRVADDRPEYTPSAHLLQEHLRAADDALTAARLLFDNRLWDGVSNRAYYAIFNAATAAVLSTAIEEIRSHRALKDLFRQRVAIERKLGLDYATDLDRVFDLRLNADYKPAYRVTEAAARDAIGAAERFIAKVRELLSAS